ncbi:hypothetical protein [Microbacterium sp.]|uniref:hypothetical protein n=1 Tax=Microbacterium sp. TaxID=51671 RepID=UPI0039E4CC60
MFTITHARAAGIVLLGYRIHNPRTLATDRRSAPRGLRGAGSLPVGLFDAEGRLHDVGGVSAVSDARRLDLIDELAPSWRWMPAAPPSQPERFTVHGVVRAAPKARYDPALRVRGAQMVPFEAL